ncbi:lipoprotein insertase outer membrane protein LolB [Cellvibrio fibrivorans]|uniref:Outer-membrane lipoprotein LolB n=1 Tax=Cellvibrio fibrivorans TaxID=126350 RepID=A0ABU1UZ88_9GAMM|nr:lipoprotein insertase outer membrane protein LolB [Cellvibrio fibrivorans]MDR7090512.1 outer membrane lipoprotein LolB [Cellvibrio fibrivorans]
MMQYRFLIIVSLLFISGCVHRGSLTPPQDVLEHQRQVQAIGDWQLTGKLGIRTSADSGSASVKWAQQLASYQINLSGPLGQKSMIITGTPEKVRLEQTGEPVQEAKTAEALIKKSAGWTLPVAQLAYWVRGVPAPKLRITQLQQNETGLIAQLIQGGWSIYYSNYRDQTFNGINLPLPGKITAEYKDVRLVLVIRDWRLGAAQ